MDLEKQICGIELAKKLRELGVKQESIFWHWATDVEEDGLTWWTVSEKEPRRGKKVRELSTPRHYRGKVSAFTIAELGEMLPGAFQSGKRPYEGASPKEHLYECWPYEPVHGKNIPTQTALTEADARAKMLIYLIENKLVMV